MVVLMVNLLSVMVNVVVDYVLIEGRGGFPELGIRGAAIGTIASRAVATACYALLMWLESRRSDFDFRKETSIDLELVRRILRFGLPTGIHFFVDVAGFSIFVFVIGSLGAKELAATSLAFNLNTLAFVRAPSMPVIRNKRVSGDS